jgi:hypothetical protein
VVLAANGWPSTGHSRLSLFLIPSGVKTGEIAHVLRDGYAVSLLADGFRELIRAL